MGKIKVWYNRYMTSLYPNKGQAVDSVNGYEEVSYGELICDDSVKVSDLGVTVLEAYIVAPDAQSYCKFFTDKSQAIKYAVKNGYATEESSEFYLRSLLIDKEEYFPISVPFEVNLYENEKGFFFKKNLHPEITGAHGKKKLYFLDKACKNEICRGTATITSIKEYDRFGFFHAEMTKYSEITDDALKSFMEYNKAYFQSCELYRNTCVGDMLVIKSSYGDYYTAYVMEGGFLQAKDYADSANCKMAYLRKTHPARPQVGYKLLNKEDVSGIFKEFSQEEIEYLIRDTKSYFSIVQKYSGDFGSIIVIGNTAYIIQDDKYSIYSGDIDGIKSSMKPEEEDVGVNIICKNTMGVDYDEFEKRITEFDFNYYRADYCDKYVSDLIDSAVDFGFLDVKTINNIMFVEVDKTVLAEAFLYYSKEEMSAIFETISRINTSANEAVISKSRSGKLHVEKNISSRFRKQFTIV